MIVAHNFKFWTLTISELLPSEFLLCVLPPPPQIFFINLKLRGSYHMIYTKEEHKYIIFVMC